MTDDTLARTQELESLALSLGADLAGVANLAPMGGISTYPSALLAPFTFGVSVAVHLSDAIIDGITPTDPTAVYARHYVTANALLDQITFRLAGHIQRHGHRALPIHASQQMGPRRWYGAISHKAIARGAGLGWIGQSLLLITPEFGPRVRLASVLTDMPLASGGPLPRACGGCHVCMDACPAKAIIGFAVGDYPESRELALNTAACAQRLDFFGNEAQVGQPVCGMCVQACPYGRKSGKM
jgi:epoxyqueuosine reductase